jgi:hypothetical protein
MPALGSAGEPLMDNKYEDGVTLTITTKPFDPKAHKITKCKETLCETEKNGKPVYYMCSETICSIDGKPAYGTYGRIPKQEVASLIFEKNGKKISLDVSAMYNPNVNNTNIRRYIDVMPWHEGSYRVRGYFSHDDGDDDTYICLWLVTPEGSIRNHISDYGSLVTLTTEAQKDFGLPITTGSGDEK